MKVRFLSITMVLTLSMFLLSGCFSQDDENDPAPAVAAAEEVTIADIQGLGVTPTGTGTAPASEAETTAAVQTIGGAEDKISEALEGVITYTKANLRKSIKASIIAKAKAVKADEDEDEDPSGSWNQSGTFNLADSGYFTSGTAEYETSGSWLYTDNYVQVGTSNVWQGSDSESENASFKYKITNAKMRYDDITLDGFVNENFNESENSSATGDTQGTEDDNDDVFSNLSINSGMNISHRSGYSISGRVVCYIVVSLDFSVAINKQFTETELAGMTGDQIDAALMAVMTKSGGMTVKIYDAAAALVYNESYTAEELWTNFFGDDDEDEDNNDEGETNDDGGSVEEDAGK